MLTDRQKTVFAYYVLMGGRRAAVRLGVKINTVHDTVVTVYRKLGVQSKREALRCLGWQLQLVDINKEPVAVTNIID